MHHLLSQLATTPSLLLTEWVDRSSICDVISHIISNKESSSNFSMSTTDGEVYKSNLFPLQSILDHFIILIERYANNYNHNDLSYYNISYNKEVMPPITGAHSDVPSISSILYTITKLVTLLLTLEGKGSSSSSITTKEKKKGSTNSTSSSTPSPNLHHYNRLLHLLSPLLLSSPSPLPLNLRTTLTALYVNLHLNLGLRSNTDKGKSDLNTTGEIRRRAKR